jgi:hypothetical protein
MLCPTREDQDKPPIHIHPEDGNCNVAETLDNSQYSMWLIPESQSFTLFLIDGNIQFCSRLSYNK